MAVDAYSAETRDLGKLFGLRVHPARDRHADGRPPSTDDRETMFATTLQGPYVVNL